MTGRRQSTGSLREVERDLAKTNELLGVLIEEKRQLARELTLAEQHERSRIAAAMHDGPLQILTTVGLRLDLLSGELEDSRLASDVARLRRDFSLAMQALRMFMTELHPPNLDRTGLAAALRSDLEQVRQEAGVQYRISDNLIEEPTQGARALAYRLASEVLLNIRKHARAQRIEVELESRADDLWVRISDDGVGFDQSVDRPGHLGLSLLGHRAERVGGRVEITSAPGQGTVVELMLPSRLALTSPAGPLTRAGSAAAGA